MGIDVVGNRPPIQQYESRRNGHIESVFRRLFKGIVLGVFPHSLIELKYCSYTHPRFVLVSFSPTVKVVQFDRTELFYSHPQPTRAFAIRFAQTEVFVRSFPIHFPL